MNNPCRILVVEDSLPAQQIAKKYLTDLNCLVDVVVDSECAIKKCNNFHYDLILMDLGLYPGPNGFETAKIIKNESKFNKSTPIIALSVHSEADFYQELNESFITGFIPKPFTRFEAEEIVLSLREKFLRNHSFPTVGALWAAK